MKKYNKYKPSGIKWIGDIPEHWEKKKISRSFNLIGSGTTPKADNLEFYTGGTINWVLTGDLNDGVIEKTSKRITELAFEKHSTLKIYPKNTLLIALYGATIGKVGLLNIEACTNQACCALSEGIDIDYKFMFYWLIASKTHIINLSYGGGQPNISQETIKSLYTPVPSQPEQTQIATYLDQKIAQIDQTITQKEKLIELYEEEKKAIINQAVTKGLNKNVKLTPSGIEWLGDIPEHWEVTKIKHVAKIFGRIGYRGYKTTDLVEKGNGAITISPSNMKDYNMDFTDCTYLSWEKYEESPEIKIYNGDILFVKTGSTYGKSSLVNNLNEKATINPQSIVIKKIKCDNKLLWYIIKSEGVQFQVEGTVVGGTIPTISQEKINNYKFPLTTNKNEQSQIVQHIEEQSDRLNQAITKAKKEIELIKEYRQALIFEAVTGKIDVREETV